MKFIISRTYDHHKRVVRLCNAFTGVLSLKLCIHSLDCSLQQYQHKRTPLTDPHRTLLYAATRYLTIDYDLVGGGGNHCTLAMYTSSPHSLPPNQVPMGTDLAAFSPSSTLTASSVATNFSFHPNTKPSPAARDKVRKHPLSGQSVSQTFHAFGLWVFSVHSTIVSGGPTQPLSDLVVALLRSTFLPCLVPEQMIEVSWKQQAINTRNTSQAVARIRSPEVGIMVFCGSLPSSSIDCAPEKIITIRYFQDWEFSTEVPRTRPAAFQSNAGTVDCRANKEARLRHAQTSSAPRTRSPSGPKVSAL